VNLKILLAEDHVVMREALSSLIDRQEGMQIVAQADNGEMALQLAE